MGLALDTVLVDVHNAATTAIGLTNGTTTNSGDSLGVRYFTSGQAQLLNVMLQGSSAPRRVRLLSPRLHDNVTGISFQALESPTEFMYPPDYGQPLYQSDVLTAQMDAAASSDTLAALQIFYSDLQGVNANLKTWAQIKNNIINIKPVEVDCTSSATIGTWVDTLLTTTENQLKANYNYALLGFTESANLTCVGIKGPDTGNLRVCCPAASPTLKLTDYFRFISDAFGIPAIPVINANNRFATYISVAANTASVASNVFPVFAQLSN
jgi:hypothetical protein